VESAITRVNWQMYQSLVGAGLLCAILIVSVFTITAPVIKRNKEEALQRALFSILPQVQTYKAFVRNQHGRFVIRDDETAPGQVVYVGYHQDNKIAGIAVPANGMGYQDTIELLYAYEPTRQAIVGLVILSNRETPGLGSKIESDAVFHNNFKQLDVALTANQSSLLHDIETVKSGTKTNAWEIDGISGATISSKAVGTIVQKNAAVLIPAVAQRVKDFTIEQTHNQR